ncbi:MAG: hypothetical protein KKD38_02625 [Candidatus Delongbacteria bacterium]|nr:hypothetical protein [Candidatus Delongbacteria bacterium]MCG2761010.1 hypothetical protein [Candidatus Delongbacteria bacterium]
MSIGKALLFGAIGVGAGILLAAWAETMDDGETTDSDLSFDDENETTVNEETDDVLEESPVQA